MELFLYALIGLVATSAACEWWMRAAVRRGARQTVEMNRALYSGSHEFAAVSAADFGRLDLAFYDRMRSLLEAEGFRYLGDVEDLTITRQSPSLRTFIRAMSGDRGEVMASFYHVKARGWMALLQGVGLIPRRLKMLDLESELSDGSWVITANALHLDTTPAPESMDLERLPVRTPAPELLARHRQRLRAALAERPELRARRVDSLNEALAAQDRMQQIRNRQMADPEALVETLEAQNAAPEAKRMLAEAIRRTAS